MIGEPRTFGSEFPGKILCCKNFLEKNRKKFHKKNSSRKKNPGSHNSRKKTGPGQSKKRIPASELPLVQYIVHAFPDLVLPGRSPIRQRTEECFAARVRRRKFHGDLPAHVPVSLIKAAHDKEMDDLHDCAFRLQRSVGDFLYRRFLVVRECRKFP